MKANTKGKVAVRPVRCDKGCCRSFVPEYRDENLGNVGPYGDCFRRYFACPHCGTVYYCGYFSRDEAEKNPLPSLNGPITDADIKRFTQVITEGKARSHEIEELWRQSHEE